jgi:hypothetical protein
MKRLLVLTFLIIGLILSFPTEVKAETSTHVTVIAYGYIAGSPGGFAITYISDWEVELAWTPGNGSAETMVRAAFGRQPTSITDGYLVYSGSNSSCIDTAVSLTNSEPVYYSAWAKSPEGVYSTLYSSGNTEGLMSASFLFIGWIILSLGLTFLAFKVKLMLFRMAPAISWTGLGIYLLIGNITNLGIASAWTQMLGFVFIIMAIGSLLLQVRSDSVHESTTRGSRGTPGAETERWEEWGPKKKRGKTAPSSAERQAAYRMQVRGAVARGVARRK